MFVKMTQQLKMVNNISIFLMKFFKCFVFVFTGSMFIGYLDLKTESALPPFFSKL